MLILAVVPYVVLVCEWGSRTLVCLCHLGRISSFLGMGQELDVGDSFGVAGAPVSFPHAEGGNG